MPSRRRPGWGAVAAALMLAAALGLVPAPSRAAEDTGASGAQSERAAPVPDTYRIGPNDVLGVEVRGEPDFSGSYIVRPDGRITVPVVGDIRVLGRTPGAVRDAVRDSLSDYIQAPVVMVSVEAARGTFADRIRVLGGAVRPQSFAYREGMTALDVVLALEGLPATAATSKAYLLRRTDGTRERIALDLGKRPEEAVAATGQALRPGDVVVIPEGAFAGDWRFSQSASASQTFTDNVGLDPDDEKESALITEIGPGIALEANLARVRGALNAQIRLERQSLNGANTSVEGDLAGTGTAEVLEDLLFTDVAASISQENLDSGQGTSASEANDTNERTVQTYRVSPYVVRRLGRLAQVQARYAADISRIDQGSGGDTDRFGATDNQASDSIQHRVSLNATSGPRFGRFGWNLSASASELRFEDSGQRDSLSVDDDNNNDLSRRDVRLRNSYAVRRDLALIGDIGYQKVDSDSPTDSFESPVWSVGFEWTPSPASRLFATFGKEDDDRSATVEAHHDVTARTRLSLRLDERVATGQERLFTGLPQDPEDLIDFDPRTDGFTIRDELTRTRTLTASVDSDLGRDQVGVSATYETEDEDAIDGDQTEERLRFTGNYGRALFGDLRFSLNASFETTEFSEIENAGDVEDNEINAAAGLNYSGLRNIDLSLTYFFAHRDSTRAQDEFTENAVTVSGRITF